MLTELCAAEVIIPLDGMPRGAAQCKAEGGHSASRASAVHHSLTDKGQFPDRDHVKLTVPHLPRTPRLHTPGHSLIALPWLVSLEEDLVTALSLEWLPLELVILLAIILLASGHDEARLLGNTGYDWALEQEANLNTNENSDPETWRHWYLWLGCQGNTFVWTLWELEHLPLSVSFCKFVKLRWQCPICRIMF